MTLAQRYDFFRAFDFSDVYGGPANWVDRPYEQLPAEVKDVLRLLHRWRI